MTPAALAAWLLALPAVTDGHGLPIPMPASAARDIAIVALETDNPPLYAATLRLFSAMESGFRVKAAGDCPGMKAGSPLCTRALGAVSCGAYQTPCASTPERWTGVEQTRYALGILKHSMVTCPSHPLSLYMSGRCANVGAAREHLIALAVAVPVNEGEGT